MYISGTVYELIRYILNLWKSFNCFRHYSCLLIPYFRSLFLQASMDLPPDKAKLLRNYDDEKKWDMICDQVSKMNYITQKSKTVRGTHFLSFSIPLYLSSCLSSSLSPPFPVYGKRKFRRLKVVRGLLSFSLCQRIVT